MKISTIWTQDLKDQKAKDKFLSSWIALQDDTVIKKLKTVLESKREELCRSRNADYDSPSWAYKQADILGQIKTIDFMIEILYPKEGLN